MYPAISEQKQIKNDLPRHVPAVSIILPFEPKMTSKSELERGLKSVLKSIDFLLMNNYSDESATLVSHKLQVLVQHLNYFTHKRSIAIFVSPFFEKVLYLDFQVEEKIAVTNELGIRDILSCRKQTIKCLLMLLSSKASKMYYSNGVRFILLKSNIRDLPSRSKSALGKTLDLPFYIKTEKIKQLRFLHHMDEGLSIILKSYQLPVFVIGRDEIVNRFKNITKNSSNIVKYIQGNYLHATESEIEEMMHPYITEWEKIKQANTLQILKYAEGDHKLASGITESWAAAVHKNSRLLVIEKDFMYSQATDGSFHHNEIPIWHKPFYIKDKVDSVIEKVLESGGAVELVDNDMLKDYDHIATVKFY